MFRDYVHTQEEGYIHPRPLTVVSRGGIVGGFYLTFFTLFCVFQTVLCDHVLLL